MNIYKSFMEEVVITSNKIKLAVTAVLASGAIGSVMNLAGAKESIDHSKQTLNDSTEQLMASCGDYGYAYGYEYGYGYGYGYEYEYGYAYYYGYYYDEPYNDPYCQ